MTSGVIFWSGYKDIILWLLYLVAIFHEFLMWIFFIAISKGDRLEIVVKSIGTISISYFANFRVWFKTLWALDFGTWCILLGYHMFVYAFTKKNLFDAKLFLHISVSRKIIIYQFFYDNAICIMNMKWYKKL